MTGTRNLTSTSATSKRPQDTAQDAIQDPAIRQAAHQAILEFQRYTAQQRRKSQQKQETSR